MVGLAVLMLLLGLAGAWLRWRGRLYYHRAFLRFAVAMGPAGIVAILCGWMTTEIGRQPWVVYGVMRTSDAVAQHSELAMSVSLVLFVVVYFAVFGTGISYLLKLVAIGPNAEPAPPRRPTPIARAIVRRARCRRRPISIRHPGCGRMTAMLSLDLPLIWVLIIGFGLMMYVVMDGFDLGIGILFPFVPHTADRDLMVNTVAPVWDGNETWLVLGGAGLLGAFPLAYSVLLSALYFPIVLMLMGLILRGVAFEFRFKADVGHRPFWDIAFAGGSYMAAFFQEPRSARSSTDLPSPARRIRVVRWTGCRRSACSPARA